MILSELINGVDICSVSGDVEVEISSLTYDSRSACEGSCFFAVAGTVVDGHNYIAGAIERGAKAVVCQHIPEEVKDVFNIRYRCRCCIKLIKTLVCRLCSDVCNCSFTRA